MQRHPAIEPYQSGMLDVGDGHRMHWETRGNPDGTPVLLLHGGPGAGSNPGARRFWNPARYRIVSHYFSHGAWLDQGQILRDAHRLAGIPGVLIHGRLDLGGPLDVPWLLARSWPDAVLQVVAEAGHRGNERTMELLVSAADRFADAV